MKRDVIGILNSYLFTLLLISLLIDLGLWFVSAANIILISANKLQQLMYWPGCILILLVLVFKGKRQKSVAVEAERQFALSRWILAGILLAAAAVRILHLGLVPLNFDEASWTLWSAVYASPSQITEYAHLPVMYGGVMRPLYPDLLYLAQAFLRNPLFLVRVPAVILGVVTVWLNYIFVRRLLSERAAVFSSLWLALLPWHVIFSRTGEEKVLVPLFGILIFYFVFRAVKERNQWFFILSCFFLGAGALYTYQTAVILVAVFLVFLYWARRELQVFSRQTLYCGLLVFAVFVYPFISLAISGKFDFAATFYRFYQKNVFAQGFYLVNLLQNLTNNIFPVVKGLFFRQKIYFLYGEALPAPLLVNGLVLLLLLTGGAQALRRRRLADKLLLSWLAVGFFTAISFVDFVEARYLLVILPVPLIMVAGVLDSLLNFKPVRNLVMVIFAAIICLTGWQLGQYFWRAPEHFDTCRENCYGTEQAAQYLLARADLEEARIVIDDRMAPLQVYLDFYKLKSQYRNYSFNLISSVFVDITDLQRDKSTYYLIWAPESHPPDYADGIFRRLTADFTQLYPSAQPLSTIYYPNDLPALRIYRVGQPA